MAQLTVVKSEPLQAEQATPSTTLPAPLESAFQRWYTRMAGEHDLNPNPDAPEQAYDYRAAFKVGAKPDASGHWPSQFKHAGHPNEVVGGFNTRTGERVAGTKRANRQELIRLGWDPATAARLAVLPDVAAPAGELTVVSSEPDDPRRRAIDETMEISRRLVPGPFMSAPIAAGARAAAPVIGPLRDRVVAGTKALATTAAPYVAGPVVQKTLEAIGVPSAVASAAATYVTLRTGGRSSRGSMAPKTPRAPAAPRIPKPKPPKAGTMEVSAPPPDAVLFRQNPSPAATAPMPTQPPVAPQPAPTPQPSAPIATPPPAAWTPARVLDDIADRTAARATTAAPVVITQKIKNEVALAARRANAFTADTPEAAKQAFYTAAEDLVRAGLHPVQAVLKVKETAVAANPAAALLEMLRSKGAMSEAEAIAVMQQRNYKTGPHMPTPRPK